MMKQKITAMLLLVCSISYAQVGINTETPTASLDIVGKKLSDSKDGILIPRITKSELNAKSPNTYSATQNSVLIFVTDVAAGTSTTSSAQTTKITQPGFYFFQNTEWLPISSNNPWMVQNSTVEATKDSENIYRNNKVSIGADLSATTRNEQLYVYGNSMFQTKNDGMDSNNNNKQTYFGLNRESYYIQNANRSSTNAVESRAQFSLDNYGISPINPNYGVARIKISTGAKIAGANRYASYDINSSDTMFNNGLGAHNFTTWTPDKTNSVIAMDERGLKIGYLNNINASGVNVNGLGDDLGSLWVQKVTAYYLPKNSPTVGQVLMFDQVVNPGVGTESYTTTKWGTPSGSSSINFYTQNGTVSSQRIVDVTDSNMVTYRRTGTANTSDVPLLSTNGSMQTMALRLDSDERLKENIKSIDGELALKLKPITYTWNAKGKEKGGNNKLQYGFIAQEVEKIMPDAVFTDKEGYKSVNYLEFIPILTQKIKDQDETIKSLLKRVETLEANNKK